MFVLRDLSKTNEHFWGFGKSGTDRMASPGAGCGADKRTRANKKREALNTYPKRAGPEPGTGAGCCHWH